MIERLKKKKQNLCIGSSTIMLIGRQNNFNFINLGFSGFTLEDMEAIAKLFYNNKVEMDTLIELIMVTHYKRDKGICSLMINYINRSSNYFFHFNLNLK